MNDHVKPPLVRPAFLWLAGLAFLLGLLLAGVAGWDYVETRAFRTMLQEIRAKGEPTTLRDIRPRPTSEEGLAADRYFRAAVVLASSTPDERSLFDRVREAERTGEWPEGLVDSARHHLESHAEALQILDRAAPLMFDGLTTGADRVSAAFFQLARLAALRTSLQVLTRDEVHAADSLYAELRYRSVVDWAWGMFRVPVGDVERVGSVLSAIHPTAAALARLSQALADLDRDDAVKQWFVGQRAVYLDSIWRGIPITEAGFGLRVAFSERVGRLFAERSMHKRFEALAVIIAALDQPWPVRSGAIAALYDSPQPAMLMQNRAGDIAMSNEIVDDLALVRVARVAVATEQYRRDHRDALPARLDDVVPGYLPKVPVDPYSGWPLLYRTESHTYAVYSIGPNHRDDGADFGLLRFLEGGRQSRDVGMRIRYR